MPEPLLLDRQFLERLDRIALRWKHSFAGLVGGHNNSHFAGGGIEFLDHRSYHQGDDLRAVNWRAFMRLDKMFLKLFQIEPRVPVRLLLDTSGSMGADAGAKFDYARRLAASLCYVGLVRLDIIDLVPFAQELHEGITCGGGRQRFGPVSAFIERLKPAGVTDYQKMVRQFLNEYPQRGLVIVVSDFLDDPGCKKALQHLADYGNELMLVQLWADEDRVPPWKGEMEFVNAESGVTMKFHVDEPARIRYTEAFDRFAADLKQTALRADGRYVGLPVSMPLEEAIFGNMVRAGSVA